MNEDEQRNFEGIFNARNSEGGKGENLEQENNLAEKENNLSERQNPIFEQTESNRNAPSDDIAMQKQRIRDRYKGVNDDSIKVIPAQPKENFFNPETEKRVAVYARVSTDGINQTSSYELQRNYYEDMIKAHPKWNLVEIYADEGISGTSLKHRDSFIRMIKDCKAGKIDFIIVKNVARFARNIVDCIGYVRELKNLPKPVGVYFESEHIYSLQNDSEMALSFLATMAQEESHIKSNAMNSSVDMRFKMGIFLTPVLLGYDHDKDGNLVINESEAATVRFIFFSYLYGYSTSQIADALTDLGRETKKGNTSWSAGSVYQILMNERYCGDLIARKTFTPNYLDHKSKKNTYQMPKYRKEDHHEAIITREDFFAVQIMIRNAKYGNKGYYPELQVVKRGALKGYVTVHPKWAGFMREDYVHVSNSVTEGPEIEIDDPIQLIVQKGSFDLSGYELVRKAFFSPYGQIEVTFYPDYFYFNGSAIHKFPDAQRVEILIMPREQKMAVRPTTDNSRYQIQWSYKKDNKLFPYIITGRAYLPTLYEIFGWEKDAEYKVMGCFQSGEESFLLFDMTEAVLIIKEENTEDYEEQTQTSEKRKRAKRIRTFPDEWGDSFGENYYSAQAKDNHFQEEVKQAEKTENVTCNLGDEGVTTIEEAANQMNHIIKKIGEGLI